MHVVWACACGMVSVAHESVAHESVTPRSCAFCLVCCIPDLWLLEEEDRSQTPATGLRLLQQVSDTSKAPATVMQERCTACGRLEIESVGASDTLHALHMTAICSHVAYSYVPQSHVPYRITQWVRVEAVWTSHTDMWCGPHTLTCGVR